MLSTGLVPVEATIDSYMKLALPICHVAAAASDPLTNCTQLLTEPLISAANRRPSMKDVQKAARMNGFASENLVARRKREKGASVKSSSCQSLLPRGQAPWRAVAKATMSMNHIVWLLLISCATSCFAGDAALVEWVEGLGGKAKANAAGDLVEVDLRHCWLTDPDFKRIGQMPQLQSIQLGYTKVTDQGLEYLKALTQVRVLDLYYAESISDAGLAHLKNWQHLKSLNVRGTKVTSTLFDHLVAMPELEELDVGFSRVNDDNFERLGELPKLRRLSIGGNKMSGVALPLLKLVPTLRELDLSGQQRTDSGLWSVLVSDPNCEVIASLVDLESLDLTDTAISDRGLQRLASLEKLKRFRLTRTKITSKGLVGLSNNKNLRELNCAGAEGVDDSSLKLFSAMTSLQLLQLQGTKVSVAGLLTANKPPALQRLVLSHIEAEEREKLQAHWPGCSFFVP